MSYLNQSIQYDTTAFTLEAPVMVPKVTFPATSLTDPQVVLAAYLVYVEGVLAEVPHAMDAYLAHDQMIEDK